MRKNKPSRTAFKAALNIVKSSAKPEMATIFPLCIVEATANLLIASGLVSATIIRWLRSRSMVSIYEAFDWIMPGQLEAFAHRKSFCEHQIKESIRQGTTQVINLGAGYDTTGWCLAPEFPDVDFFEIDHPATAQVKQRGIERMGMRNNLHLIAADLAEQRLADVLIPQKSWNKAAQTVVVAEALLMYLPVAAVRDLFIQCAAVTGAGSRIAFTYIGTNEDGSPDAGPWTSLILWALKVNGEPWLWSIDPGQLSHFLEKTGWRSAPNLLGTSNKHGVEFFAVAVK